MAKEPKQPKAPKVPKAVAPAAAPKPAAPVVERSTVDNPASFAPEAEVEAGARVVYIKASGAVHRATVSAMHQDGSADLAVDDGTSVKAVPKAKAEREKGVWIRQ